MSRCWTFVANFNSQILTVQPPSPPHSPLSLTPLPSSLQLQSRSHYILFPFQVLNHAKVTESTCVLCSVVASQAIWELNLQPLSRLQPWPLTERIGIFGVSRLRYFTPIESKSTTTERLSDSSGTKTILPFTLCFFWLSFFFSVNSQPTCVFVRCVGRLIPPPPPSLSVSVLSVQSTLSNLYPSIHPSFCPCIHLHKMSLCKYFVVEGRAPRLTGRWPPSNLLCLFVQLKLFVVRHSLYFDNTFYHFLFVPAPLFRSHSQDR